MHAAGLTEDTCVLEVGGGDSRIGADVDRSRCGRRLVARAHGHLARPGGLPVVRYDPDVLANTLGRDLTLVETRRHVHTTPWGATQSFQ